MADNLIQIKRSLDTAAPTSLANGELAYTANGDVLFIGSNGSIVPIAGARNPGVLTANQALVANSTGYLDTIKSANAEITALYANGSYGTAGQVLVSSGADIYWGTGTSGSNTEVQFNDSGVANASPGFTFDKSTNTLFVANTVETTNFNVETISGNNITVDTSLTVGDGSSNTYITSSEITTDGTLFVSGNTTLDSDVTVNGNTEFNGAINTINGDVVLGSNTTDTVAINGVVNTHIIPSANVTYDLGTVDYYWNNVYAEDVHAVTGEFDGNVTIGGDLIVSGNVTTTNVSTLEVSDPLIHLASENTTDSLDIGWVGHYDSGSGNAHAGVFRDASSNEFYIFVDYQDAAIDTGGVNLINIADPTFALATLNTYLHSGGLTTNTTNATIASNSTFSVTVVANSFALGFASDQDILVANADGAFNSLSLGGSGYVLQSNGTALVYDTLDGGTF